MEIGAFIGGTSPQALRKAQHALSGCIRRHHPCDHRGSFRPGSSVCACQGGGFQTGSTKNYDIFWCPQSCRRAPLSPVCKSLPVIQHSAHCIKFCENGMEWVRCFPLRRAMSVISPDFLSNKCACVGAALAESMVEDSMSTENSEDESINTNNRAYVPCGVGVTVQVLPVALCPYTAAPFKI